MKILVEQKRSKTDGSKYLQVFIFYKKTEVKTTAMYSRKIEKQGNWKLLSRKDMRKAEDGGHGSLLRFKQNRCKHE